MYFFMSVIVGVFAFVFLVTLLIFCILFIKWLWRALEAIYVNLMLLYSLRRTMKVVKHAIDRAIAEGRECEQVQKEYAQMQHLYKVVKVFDIS